MITRDCDGVTRRDALRIGVLGATALTLAQYLRIAEADPGKSRERSAIFIFQSGGPSHLDSLDPKPDAPAEYRGEFETIATRVPGIRFCEHLPRLAECADQFALLRGVTHNLADHNLGQKYLATGNRPLVSLEYPGYQAVVSKELPCDRDLPPAIGIPFSSHGVGYLGLEYGALELGSQPRAGQDFVVRGIDLGKRRSVDSFQNWRELRDDLDRPFGEAHNDTLLQGLDRFSRRAAEVIRSPRVRQALDLNSEPESVLRDFGKDPVSLSMLAAVRLVEAGVRFVTIHKAGWDTHTDNFPKLRNNLLPPIDQGVPALLRALRSRGLLDTTTVFLTGEFGRTPKLNDRGGRDHWPRAMTCLLAGGGIRGGQVLGASDERGQGPAGTAYTPDDVAATFYHTLGIDPTKEYLTPTGRPVMIVREGKKIPELYG